MLSPARLGAHPAAHVVAPSLALIDGWTAAAGVTLVTLAPELPGALEVIDTLRARGVVVAVGHTDCDAATFAAAREAGASFVTHLFNAMRPFAHRDPGPVGAALADPAIVCGLIADGVHVDPVAVAMAVRALGVDRVALVTDAVAAMPAAPLHRSRSESGPQGGQIATENEGRLGGVDVVVGAGEVRTAGGVLAGSVCPLDQALRNLIACTGLDLPAAVRTVTATPAAVLGRDDIGALTVGARADLAVLDGGAGVVATIVGGEVAWKL